MPCEHMAICMSCWGSMSVMGAVSIVFDGDCRYHYEPCYTRIVWERSVNWMKQMGRRKIFCIKTTPTKGDCFNQENYRAKHSSGPVRTERHSNGEDANFYGVLRTEYPYLESNPWMFISSGQRRPFLTDHKVVHEWWRENMHTSQMPQQIDSKPSVRGYSVRAKISMYFPLVLYRFKHTRILFTYHLTP